MAQKNNHHFKDFFDLSWNKLFPLGEEPHKVPTETAYLIFYELLNQIQASPIPEVEDIKKGKDISSNEPSLIPFKIQFEDIGIESKEASLDQLKKAFEFLSNYDKQWLKIKNAQGDTVHSYQGLMANLPLIYSDHMIVGLSVYHIKKLLQLPLTGKSIF